MLTRNAPRIIPGRAVSGHKYRVEMNSQKPTTAIKTTQQYRRLTCFVLLGTKDCKFGLLRINGFPDFSERFTHGAASTEIMEP